MLLWRVKLDRFERVVELAGKYKAVLEERLVALRGDSSAIESTMDVFSSICDWIVYQVLKGVDKRGGSIENALSDIGGRMESGAWKKSFECCCGE